MTNQSKWTVSIETYLTEELKWVRFRYRGLDEDVDNMESSFSQQMREEYVSKKIG